MKTNFLTFFWGKLQVLELALELRKIALELRKIALELHFSIFPTLWDFSIEITKVDDFRLNLASLSELAADNHKKTSHLWASTSEIAQWGQICEHLSL